MTKEQETVIITITINIALTITITEAGGNGSQCLGISLEKSQAHPSPNWRAAGLCAG